MINIAVGLFKKGLGYRQIENVFKVISPVTARSPSDSSIRLWIMRTGYFKLNAPLPNGEWMILGDVTVDIGTIKCLVTCGVDLSKLEDREDYTVTHNDLAIIGLYPTTQLNGEFACKAFQEGINRLGGPNAVKGLLIDQGSDLKKGGRLLQEVNGKVKIFHDISHKLSLVLEKDFTSDSKWDSYTVQLTQTKRLLQQTELAALQPPNQRSKARFMNTHLYIDWPDKILQSKSAGYLDGIAKERYEKYFGWLEGYASSFLIWSQKVGVVETIKTTIRQHGLSEDVYNHLLETFVAMPLEKETHVFVCDACSAMYEEIQKLDDDQILPAFTEPLESVFGSFKYHTARGGQGMTGNILTIGTLVGAPLTTEEIRKAFEATPVRDILTWVETKVGPTLSKLRNKFFNGGGRQNLTPAPC
jgi:hypothetical protein